jgi:hypothetical protein
MRVAVTNTAVVGSPVGRGAGGIMLFIRFVGVLLWWILESVTTCT